MYDYYLTFEINLLILSFDSNYPPIHRLNKKFASLILHIQMFLILTGTTSQEMKGKRK